jgi:hypothetical protein
MLTIVRHSQSLKFGLLNKRRRSSGDTTLTRRPFSSLMNVIGWWRKRWQDRFDDMKYNWPDYL